ncbi:hypothetical protein D9613_004473 [Agrocybe pediades]|uniref:Uncharacterized protein n=1 Tax=Agrocybe pediades TaxID=84607 RepID=A0A8H4QJ06_9AGAR|nr:hypothetical protein D9613_004473 [Agrocybe pediades]
MSGSLKPIGLAERRSVLELVHGGPVIPVHHNSLRYLYIECEGSPLTFFDLVTLPSLEELDYTYVRGRTFPEEAMQSAFLRDFIIRSRCPLKRLSLIAPPFITTDDLDTILRLLPSLVHFSLEFSDGFLMYQQKDVRDHLLSRLIATATIEDDAENFLPHLEVLELDYSGRIYDSSDISYWSSIIDVFGDPSELGKEGRRPLSSLLITTDRPYFVMGLPGDVVDRLVSLQKAGAKINFRVRYDDGDCEVTPVKWA